MIFLFISFPNFRFVHATVGSMEILILGHIKATLQLTHDKARAGGAEWGKGRKKEKGGGGNSKLKCMEVWKINYAGEEYKLIKYKKQQHHHKTEAARESQTEREEGAGGLRGTVCAQSPKALN